MPLAVRVWRPVRPTGFEGKNSPNSRCPGEAAALVASECTCGKLISTCKSGKGVDRIVGPEKFERPLGFFLRVTGSCIFPDFLRPTRDDDAETVFSFLGAVAGKGAPAAVTRALPASSPVTWLRFSLAAGRGKTGEVCAPASDSPLPPGGPALAVRTAAACLRAGGGGHLGTELRAWPTADLQMDSGLAWAHPVSGALWGACGGAAVRLTPTARPQRSPLLRPPAVSLRWCVSRSACTERRGGVDTPSGTTLHSQAAAPGVESRRRPARTSHLAWGVGLVFRGQTNVHERTRTVTSDPLLPKFKGQPLKFRGRCSTACGRVLSRGRAQ